MLIKACQFIATRADVLPDEWVSTLSGLHDRVPPRPFAMIREQIERELRRPLEAVYAEFDPAPLASASLAQVHRARLHDGRRCAVKVQYPGIDGIVRADLRNMTMVLDWLAKLERDFDYRVLMREALKYIPMELDFIHEADNSATMRRNFAADSERDRSRGLSRVHHAARAHDGTARRASRSPTSTGSSVRGSTSTWSRRS